MSKEGASPLRETACFFLHLGSTAFGGPAAHIAFMQEELVRRRRWLDDERFLDLMAVTSLVPGPNSTELAMHLGYVRAGARGLVVAGACFIAPAAAMVLALAVLYRTWGTLPALQGLLYGAKPAVLALIGLALWRLGRTAVRSPLDALLAAGVALVALLTPWRVLPLLGAGLFGLLWSQRHRFAGTGTGLLALPLPFLLARADGPGWSWLDHPERLPALGLFFLKVGAVLFGSGYVLVAFLEEGLVHRLGWLTRQELLDAIAAGQMTPGPVLTTSTFIGYQVSGLVGAAVATAGIFLPSFLIVALMVPWLERLRETAGVAGFLRGANAGVVGLLGAVLVSLTPAALPDLPALVLGVAAAVLLVRFRLSPLWLIPGACLIGLPFHLWL